MQFVDTNIFIRFLTKDDPKKAAACYKLFEKATKGKIKLQTTESVIAETVYILCSKRLYHLSEERVAEVLTPIIRIRGLIIPYKTVILTAFSTYVKYKLDFEDALLLAHMYRIKTNEIYSYDYGFDKVPQVTRLEP